MRKRARPVANARYARRPGPPSVALARQRRRSPRPAPPPIPLAYPGRGAAWSARQRPVTGSALAPATSGARLLSAAPGRARPRTARCRRAAAAHVRRVSPPCERGPGPAPRQRNRPSFANAASILAKSSSLRSGVEMVTSFPGRPSVSCGGPAPPSRPHGDDEDGGAQPLSAANRGKRATMSNLLLLQQEIHQGTGHCVGAPLQQRRRLAQNGPLPRLQRKMVCFLQELHAAHADPAAARASVRRADG